MLERINYVAWQVGNKLNHVITGKPCIVVEITAWNKCKIRTHKMELIEVDNIELEYLGGWPCSMMGV